MSISYLLLFLCAARVYSEITTFPPNISENLKEIDYTDRIIEHKYILPTVNGSALSDGEQYPEMGVNAVPVSLSRVLDFYNTEVLAANWNRVQKGLTNPCRDNMQTYINGLVSGTNWALKMDDASGRYSTGWFWGNHYWTGSQSLCENIAPTGNEINRQNEENVTVKMQHKDQKWNKASSPSQSAGYKTGPLAYSSVPPFQVAFFMLRVNINSTFTTEKRIIHVGLCLPLLCTDEDTKIIMESTSKASPRVTLQVEAVRSQHQRFDLWQDTTFRVLCAVTVWVVMLLIAGTGYDFYIQHLKEKRNVVRMNCTTYTNTASTLGDKGINLDMSVSDLKVYNGKSGFYTVSNSSSESGNNDDKNNSNNNNNNSVPPSSEISETLEHPYLEDKFDKKFLSCTILRRMLLAFSVRVNFNKIFDQTVGSDTIPVIHGLKSISMAWVILGHTSLVVFIYSDNMEYRKVIQKDFILQTVSNATFSVDTFFFTSGLLVSFLYFRTIAKGKLDHPITKKINGFVLGTLHFIGLLVYRFARLTAPYLFVLGVVEVCMKWFKYNSIFEPPFSDHENCPKFWWRNVLYVNTLFPAEEMCMIWSWYLSDDTQFYVIGAILLILATRHFKSSASLLLISMASSWMTTGYIAYSNSHVPGVDDPLALFDKIYDKPWTRLGPYLVGMGVGWLLFKTNCHIKMSKLAVTVGWLTCSACLLSLVYGPYEVNLSPVTGAMYSALSHTAWAVGLAWIVIACTTGHGGYVNSLLSASIFYPFSRVTYCAYLIHPILLRIIPMCMDHPLHLGKGIVLIIFLGLVVVSYALSFAISITFEGPSVSMLRILSRLTPNNPQKK